VTALRYSSLLSVRAFDPKRSKVITCEIMPGLLSGSGFAFVFLGEFA